MMHGALVRRFRLVAALLLVFSAGAVSAFDPKEPTSVLDLQEFFLPELYLSSAHAPLDEVLGELPNRAAWDRFLAAAADRPGGIQVWIDPRSGAATNLLGSFPLIPGSGVGNQVTLGSLGARLGRPVATVDAAAVADAARQFILGHAELLGVDPSQLGKLNASQVNPDLWQVSAPQHVGGVEVRHARLVASISHGNLVTVGTEAWGRVRIDTTPAMAAAKALAAGFEFAGGRTTSDFVLVAPKLELVPVAPSEHQAGDAFVGPIGEGYRHRLVWTFIFQREPELASWEVMVDAGSGEVIALQDANQHIQR